MNNDRKSLMLSDGMENTHLYLSKSCRPKHFSQPLNNLKPISSSQMLFKATCLGSNADGISNFKAAWFFHLKASSRFETSLSKRKDLPKPLVSGLMNKMS